MTETFEYDVFISHNSKDKRAVRALAERLKADGLNVTWDKGKLEQARTLILCMSPAYFDSEWGTLEHHTLLFRDPTDAQRRFIPLLIEDCTPPDVIAQFATIDWRTPSDEVYDRLLTACRGDDEGGEPAAREEQAIQEPMVLEGHTDKVWGVAITPYDKTVVSGSSDKTLKVWDLATGHCLATFKGHTGWIRGVAVTLDGKTVVSCAEDNTLKVWDLATGHCRATFEGHTSVIRSFAVTPDGKTVVSGSDDKTLKVWDLESGRCRATLEGHTCEPTAHRRRF
jgi:WD40 repeat protein